MTHLLDCMVSYFGLDDTERPNYRRYVCYHIFAGPGPTVGTGVAAITTLAVHNEDPQWTSCQQLHSVKAGGAAAALAAAVRYLDAYHQTDHLQKVQSDIRGFDAGPSAKAPPMPETPFRKARRVGVL
jgi:hypothetical protein